MSDHVLHKHQGSGGNQNLEQIDKKLDGSVERSVLMGVRYVPLTDKEVQYKRR